MEKIENKLDLEEMEKRIVAVLNFTRVVDVLLMSYMGILLLVNREMFLNTLGVMEKKKKMYFSWDRQYVLVGGEDGGI